MIKVERLESWEANCNPMHKTVSEMGTILGTNIEVLHMNFASGYAEYIIVVNTITGERVKLTFSNEDHFSKEEREEFDEHIIDEMTKEAKEGKIKNYFR